MTKKRRIPEDIVPDVVAQEYKRYLNSGSGDYETVVRKQEFEIQETLLRKARNKAIRTVGDEKLPDDTKKSQTEKLPRTGRVFVKRPRFFVVTKEILNRGKD